MSLTSDGFQDIFALWLMVYTLCSPVTFNAIESPEKATFSPVRLLHFSLYCSSASEGT